MPSLNKDPMSQLVWKKFKPWVVQILLLGSMGALVWWVMLPLLDAIRTRMDDTQKFSVLQEYHRAQLDRLPALEEQYNLIMSGEKQLDIILTKEHLVEFIETLERLADEAGVGVAFASVDNAFLESKVTLTEKTAKKDVAKELEIPEEGVSKKPSSKKETGIIADLPLKKFLRLTVTVTGTYPEIVRYLHKLETLPYALDVIGMDIQAQSEKDRGIQPASGTLNPFLSTEAQVIDLPVTALVEKTVVDAAFEVVVYLKE